MDSGPAPSGASRNDEWRDCPNKNPGIAAGVLHFWRDDFVSLGPSFRGVRRTNPESIYPRCPAAISGYKSIHRGLVSSIKRISAQWIPGPRQVARPGMTSGEIAQTKTP